jgi:DNA-binding XRE family transcriptional regulator
MTPLFDITTLENHKATEKLPLKCEYCGNVFYNVKKEVKKVLNNHRAVKLKYCSVNCRCKSSDTRILINCKQCNKQFKREKSKIIENNFCSQSCAGTYNNTHKIKGNRRSKLEKYIEIELIKLYPNLEILFNDKKIINSELDIYIPSLKLAFELNGIFHYEQIFSQEKLLKTQNNDKRKFQACIEQSIELCVIDTSQQKYFKEQSSKKFLLLITKIINNKLGCLMENDSTPT